MLEPNMGKNKKRRLQTPPTSPLITRCSSLNTLSSHQPSHTIPGPRPKRSRDARKLAAEVGPVAAAARTLSPSSKVLCRVSSDLSDSESIMSGVISDSDSSIISPSLTALSSSPAPDIAITTPPVPIPTSHNLRNSSAAATSPTHSPQSPPHSILPPSIINTPSFITNLPTDVRKLHITSLSPSFTLSKLNPIKLGLSIKTLCGDVDNIQHLKSGSIFITCKSFPQVGKLLHISELPFSPSPIPVKASVALNSQSVQGKIYAPELLDESLSDLCSALRSSSVVDIKKLLNDPTKSHVPLFVITFFGSTCPQYITLGFSKYRVDPYYPSPSRCSQCCQWGHTRGQCRGSLICSGCGKEGHSSSNCTSQSLSCPNCGGPHSAFSRQCPQSIKEHHICQLKAKNNISYPEARKIFLTSQTSTSSANNTPPIPPSLSATAPSLPITEYPALRPSRATALSTTPPSPKITPSPWFPPQQPGASYLPPQSPSFLSQMGPPSPANTLSRSSTSVHNPQTDFPSTSELPSTASLYKCLAPQTGTSNMTPTSSQHPNLPFPPSPPVSAPPSLASSTPFSFASLRLCLAPVIPLLIKLLLCSSLSSKVECALEIASLLNLEDSVNTAISSLGLSSLSMSQ